jgi:hypothetical protein
VGEGSRRADVRGVSTYECPFCGSVMGQEAADTSGLLHHVRVLVALYEDDMEALPGGDNDPVPAWDDVMRELRKAIADADGSTQEEQP